MKVAELNKKIYDKYPKTWKEVKQKLFPVQHKYNIIDFFRWYGIKLDMKATNEARVQELLKACEILENKLK